MTTFEFTYLQDIPRIITSVSATSIAYDKALYVSTETSVEKDSIVFYEHPRTILSIAVEDSILYLCDGTSLITRYHIPTARKMTPYQLDLASPHLLKIDNAKLYILGKSSIQDCLMTVDLRTQRIQIDKLDTSRSYLSISFYQNRSYYLTQMRNTLEGRILSSDDLIVSIEDPNDLVLVYPYAFVSGSSIRQYDLVHKTLVSTYQTQSIFRTFNRYGSMAYGGPVIYLANLTRNQIESIIAPPVVVTEIKPLSLSRSTGTTRSRIELLGININQVKCILFDEIPIFNLDIRSSTSLFFEVPKGTGTPEIRIQDNNNQLISHSLTFTYQNPMIYQCFPIQCFEGQSVYLYGDYLEEIEYVLIQGKPVDFTPIKNNSILLQSPPGTGHASIVLVDRNANVIEPNISFSYIRLESEICFPEKTLVHSDQGPIEIQKLIPGKHTIYGKEIRCITHTYSIDKEMVLIVPDTFSKGSPYTLTEISKHHKIFYRGKMIEAKDFVGRIQGVSWFPYDGSKLYNVLLYEEGRMNVQGMICETLDPSNPIVNKFI